MLKFPEFNRRSLSFLLFGVTIVLLVAFAWLNSTFQPGPKPGSARRCLDDKRLGYSDGANLRINGEWRTCKDGEWVKLQQ
jgi:hypothetical protein